MLVLTESALYDLAPAASSVPEIRCKQEGARCVASGQRTDALVTRDGDVLLLSADGERRLVPGIAEPIESVLIVGSTPDFLLLGTEGARLYRLSVADGDTQPVSTFDELPCRNTWHTPWGGPPAVRSLAATPEGWVYADIHVGSIMRSPDRGKTWEQVTPTLNEDVHEVATCLVAPNRVYANTARAVYVSEDCGRSWLHRAQDVGERYGRAIAVHPRNPDCFLATVSDGPHGDHVHGQLWLSADAGLSWLHVADGFPASTRRNIDTFQVAFSPDGTAWAAVGPSLYRGLDPTGHWEAFWEAPSAIKALACYP